MLPAGIPRPEKGPNCGGTIWHGTGDPLSPFTTNRHSPLSPSTTVAIHNRRHHHHRHPQPSPSPPSPSTTDAITTITIHHRRHPPSTPTTIIAMAYMTCGGM
jgi:hypothetical protein